MKKFFQVYVIPQSELGQFVVGATAVIMGIKLAAHLGARGACALIDAI